ncbi:MAG: MFS transporter [Planctomycetaceae bacterium]|nr:MFS transporter [Planctomycetaceae bacterium]
MWSLQTAKIVIIIAGCFGMIYTQSTTSVASIEFARELGGTGLHIGILGALPTGMLFMQFLSAYLVNRMTYRRRLWMSLSIVQRSICIPVAAGPWLFPEISDVFWLWSFLVVSAVNQGALHFCTPLWLSWMGDYLPHQGLNRYWGIRHLWMQAAAALSLGGIALILTQSSLDIIAAFALIVAVGGVLGVADVCLFYRVDEPEVTHLPQATLGEILSGPIRHRGFRSFIGFMSFWHIAAMVGAPFISLYLLSEIGMSLPQVLLLWTLGWIGGAFSSRWFGRMAEDFGNRPILVICTALKSINMIALLLTPRDPTTAFIFLVPVFMFDMALNTGFAIANNGFLLKNSPAANRTMFIAAGTAIAGLCGGLTAVVSGALLSGMEGWSASLGGIVINGFHVLFFGSMILRFVAVGVVQRIHEPDVHDTSQVVTVLIGVTPLRVLRYPIGLYRWMSANNKAPVKSKPVTVPVSSSENRE